MRCLPNTIEKAAPTMKRIIYISALLLVLSGLAIQELNAQTKNQPTKYFCGIGRIVSIDEDRSGVKISHHAIEGYMPAMSMHFKIEGDDVLSEITVGDTVRFTLRDTPELTRLVYVEKIPAKPQLRKKHGRLQLVSLRASSQLSPNSH